MNIGIDLLAVLPGISGGIEFYTHNLLTALAEQDNRNHYFLFTNLDNHEAFEIKKDNFHRLRINIHARPQLLRVGCEQILLPFICRRLQLHVLHSPSYTFPILSSVPGVLTICDMLYRIHPEAIGTWKVLFWKCLIPVSATRCKRLLTLSVSAKKDIISYLRIPRQKITVTPLALDNRLAYTKPISDQEISSVCLKYRIKKPYVLNVGGISMHKNPIILIRALKLLHQRDETNCLNLVIAGRDYGFRRRIESEILRLGLSGFVFLPGYVSRTDLPAIYSGAEVYVSPSLLEGFGLTLLEAMNFGVPLVISNRSSLPEVAGDAALIIDPHNSNQLADAIHRILADSGIRQRLVSRAFGRLKAFSWGKAASLTLMAYQEAAKS